MKVIFTRKTKDDFKKHNDYIRKQKKSDGHKYQSYESKGINDSFKKNLKGNLEKIKEPKDSIFPNKFEYNSKSHKMYVDKKSHYVVFYTIETSKNGDKVMKVQKNIHSTELRKELDKKGIKPLENSDPELQLDLLNIEYEDKVNNLDEDEEISQEIKDKYNEKKSELESKINNKKEGIEKEDKDENGNPRQHKTGPRGGKYYRVKINGEWGPWNSETNENKNMKSVKSFITESKMVSLVDYLKKMVG